MKNKCQLEKVYKMIKRLYFTKFYKTKSKKKSHKISLIFNGKKSQMFFQM